MRFQVNDREYIDTTVDNYTLVLENGLTLWIQAFNSDYLFHDFKGFSEGETIGLKFNEDGSRLDVFADYKDNPLFTLYHFYQEYY